MKGIPKKGIYNLLILLLLIGIAASLIYGHFSKKGAAANTENPIEDNLELSDSDVLQLEDSKVRVSFSEVVLSPQNETRELIVSTQEATVSTNLEDRVIQQLDISALKRSQTVTYTGTGYFIVNLNTLTEKDIRVDDKNKTVTIQIEHAKLKDIVIDPDKVEIGSVKKGLLALGKLEITVNDYNEIEQELKDRMEATFNTGDNLQEADDNALKMVKEIYEPVIHAVDSSYELVITFQ